MMIILFVFAYILIGWIVASVCLVKSMRNNNKTELLFDFVLPFCFWPVIGIISVIALIVKIIIWLIMLLGCITEEVIANVEDIK